MKRPQGFDPPPAEGRSGDSSKPRRAKIDSSHARAPDPPASQQPRRTSAQKSRDSKVTLPHDRKRRDQAAPHSRRPSSESPVSTSRESRAQLRTSARERRRFERQEVRRFTRRSRHRRWMWFAAVSIVAVVAVLLAVAVYSPLLALRTVTVDGNSKVSAADVQGAIDDQMGAPLALLDYDALKSKLDAFPLIRSFSTEIVPPSTLKIHIVERAPVGVISTPTGFQIIDPAGVVLESVLRRPEGIPLIDLAGKGTDSVAFSSVVDVMLALPTSIRERVDVVQATSKDDVRLVLSGAGQRVKWGSSERSALKARVLEELMATQEPNAHVEFDVSAPLSPVVRAD